MSEIDTKTRNLENAIDMTDRNIKNFSNNIATSNKNFNKDNEKFQGSIKSFLNNFDQNSSKINNLMNNFSRNLSNPYVGSTNDLGNNMGFLNFPSIFGGFRKNGGSVASQIPYIVGENGPEVFVPNSSGNVIPNATSRGGNNKNIVVNINITTPNADSFRKSQGQIMADINKAISKSERNL